MRWLLVLAAFGCSSPSTAPNPGGWSFAVLADLHIGEGWPSYAGQEDEKTARARSAVARINQVPDLRFVLVAGDLTDSAEQTEFDEAKRILDGLRVPYHPVLGNHDIWPYTTTSEDPTPDGPDRFTRTFGHDRNWALYEDGYVFFGLDWNSRQHATPGYGGVQPQADLGDTLAWLTARLADVPRDT